MQGRPGLSGLPGARGLEVGYCMQYDCNVGFYLWFYFVVFAIFIRTFNMRSYLSLVIYEVSICTKMYDLE